MEKRVALITGANRGIGFEAAKQLLGLGYKVILSGRDPEAVERAAAEIGAVPLVLDVTREADAKAAVRFVRERFGRLDALVNNAGVLLDEGVRGLEVPVEAVARTFEVNVYGALRLTQAFAPSCPRRARLPRLPELEGGPQHDHAGAGRRAKGHRRAGERGPPRLGANAHGRAGGAP